MYGDYPGGYWDATGWHPFPTYPVYPNYQYYTYPGYGSSAQGWQCPGCSKCYAPWVYKCDNCPVSEETNKEDNGS
jgi:hypothetical protein